MTHLLSTSTAALTAAVTDRKGVTAAEYAILAVGLVTAIAGAIAIFGPALSAKFTAIFA